MYLRHSLTHAEVMRIFDEKHGVKTLLKKSKIFFSKFIVQKTILIMSKLTGYSEPSHNLLCRSHYMQVAGS